MTHSGPTGDPRVDFRVVSQAFDSWNVQFRVDVRELLDQKALLRHLRQIKRAIAREHSLPESCMLFDGIVRKTRTADFVDVVVRITKQIFEKGSPRIHFAEAPADDGTPFARMKALLDIFYLDQFERPITLDRVMSAVSEAGIATDSLDAGIISRRLQEVLEHHIPAKNILVARGEFPESGADAEIQFFFQAVAEPGNTDVYYSSRKVSKGDLLCQKTPATVGRKAGRNVRGETLPPRSGLDVELKAGPGVALSFDHNEAVAETDGVVVVDREIRRVKTLQGVKEFPRAVRLKINPLLRVEGNQVVDISTSQCVEVVGDLHIGSRILTDSEVFVSGDVQEDSIIEAGDDITVEGQIRSSIVSSDRSVIAQGSVRDSRLSAKDKIIIKGTVKDSTVVADTVSAGAVQGSKIVARKKAILDRIDADEGNILSTICVGMLDFFKQRVRDNQEFVEKARENLSRIELLLGSDLMHQIGATSPQTILMKFLAKHRMNQDPQSKKQVEVYRRLIESVLPTLQLMAQKEAENVDLARQIAQREQGDESVVVIRERISAKTVISIDGVEGDISQLEGPAAIRSDGKGNLEVEMKRKDT